jgi:metaxin
LHVFTTEEDAKNGRPSFNPGCLKWQVRAMVNEGA